MNLKYTKGIFSNYVKVFPLEIDRMFMAIEYIVEKGTGGDLLDQLSKKTFKDTNSEYINRLRNEALKKEEGLFIVFDALVKWYETWKDSFDKFNVSNAHLKYKEQPIHTWLHCLLTGQQNIYMEQLGEDYIVIERSRWEKATSETYATNPQPMPFKQEQETIKTERIERLLKLYEKDEDMRIKEILFDKKIAVFLEDKWLDEQIEDWIGRYHLKGIKQFSSVVPLNDTGKFDYYLFLTSQASHSSKFKLESRVGKENIFLISATNHQLVFREFIKQLKGK